MDSVKSLVLSFMSLDSYDFTLPADHLSQLFPDSSSVSESNQAVFFRDVNRALREHCIRTSEFITVTKRYGFIRAFLSFWDSYRNSLFQLSDQIAQIFESHRGENPSGLVHHQVSHQIVHFGFVNWKRYILAQWSIRQDLASTIELLGLPPPFTPSCLVLAIAALSRR
jgi:hypothetical protein